MNNEIWKDIENFSKYQVSNLGRIKSKGRYTKVSIKNQDKCYRKECIVDCFINKKGYKQVTLYDDNGKPKTMRVHKLVALAFIKNEDNLPQINHKDGNKQNNHINNLEMVTCKENIQHSFKNKLQVIKSGKENHLYNRYGQYANKSKPIYQFDLEDNFIKKWNCQKDVERELGFKVQNISACALGNKKTAYGFIWKNELEV